MNIRSSARPTMHIATALGVFALSACGSNTGSGELIIGDKAYDMKATDGYSSSFFFTQREKNATDAVIHFSFAGSPSYLGGQVTSLRDNTQSLLIEDYNGGIGPVQVDEIKWLGNKGYPVRYSFSVDAETPDGLAYTGSFTASVDCKGADGNHTSELCLNGSWFNGQSDQDSALLLSDPPESDLYIFIDPTLDPGEVPVCPQEILDVYAPSLNGEYKAEQSMNFGGKDLKCYNQASAQVACGDDSTVKIDDCTWMVFASGHPGGGWPLTITARTDDRCDVQRTCLRKYVIGGA